MIFELSRRKTRVFDALSLFNFFFVLFQVVGGLSFTIASMLNVEKFGIWGVSSGAPSVMVPVAVCAGYALLLFGYFNPITARVGTGLVVIDRRRSDLFLLLFIVACLALAGVSFLIYTMSYGGPFDAIAKGDAIRSGRVEKTSVSFVKRFFPAVFVPLYFSVYHVFIKRSNDSERFLWWAILGLSIALFMPIALLEAGRAGLVMPFLYMFLIFAAYKNELYLKYALIVGSLGFVVLFFGNPFFSAMADLTKGWDYFVEGVGIRFAKLFHGEQHWWEHILEFTSNFHANTLSLSVALENTGFNKGPWLLWKDFVWGLMSLMPERLLGGSVRGYLNISTINNYYIFGGQEANTSIPPGWIAASFYTAWWFGLFVNGIALGIVGRVINNLAERNWTNFWMVPVYFVIVGMIWQGAFNGLSWAKFFGDNLIMLSVLFFFSVYFFKVKRG